MLIEKVQNTLAERSQKANSLEQYLGVVVGATQAYLGEHEKDTARILSVESFQRLLIEVDLEKRI